MFCRSWKTWSGAKMCGGAAGGGRPALRVAGRRQPSLTPRFGPCWSALVTELNAHGPQLPVYLGNRNWHPLSPEAVEPDGRRRRASIAGFVTSAFGSAPSCRQYLEDIAHAREEVGKKAPQIDKLRLFYNHPGFIEAASDRVWNALEEVPAGRRAEIAVDLCGAQHSHCGSLSLFISTAARRGLPTGFSAVESTQLAHGLS